MEVEVRVASALEDSLRNEIQAKLRTKLDHTWEVGYSAGFRDAVGFVMGLVSDHEVVEQGVRREVVLVPEPAVRELVANALIHHDFTVTGTSVMLEVYSNRVEVSNPGTPVVPVERVIDGYRSRNERLADLMRRMRLCEEKGSGIDLVSDEAERH